MVSIIKIFFVLLFFYSSHMVAGVGSSGGGGAVVCRDQNRQIESADLLDLFEAPIIHALEIERDEQNYKDQIIAAISRIKYDPFAFNVIREVISEVESSFLFLPDGVSLHAPADVGERDATLVPEGCRLEGVGFYTEQGILRVARNTFESFDETAKAAFILHEAIYYLFRQVNSESAPITSYLSRKMTAMLFSKNVLDYEAINFFRSEIFYSWNVIPEFLLKSPVGSGEFEIVITPKKSNLEFSFQVACTDYSLKPKRIEYSNFKKGRQVIKIKDAGCNGITIGRYHASNLNEVFDIDIIHNRVLYERLYSVPIGLFNETAFLFSKWYH